MSKNTKPNPVQDRPNPNSRPTPQRAPGGPTSASNWKKKAAVGTLVVVPSGNEVRVRTPGMQAFLSNGIIPNGLMPMIQDAMKMGEAPSEDDAQKLMDDPDKINEILQLSDAVALFCFIEPALSPIPLEPEPDAEGNYLPIPLGDARRDEDVLYVDEVDLNDKLFIFQFAVGGTAKLEQFRQEQGSDVVDVPERAALVMPTE